MRSTIGFCATLTCLVAGFWLVPAADAQDRAAPPSATTPGTTAAPANISDKKIDATAAAVKRVAAVSQSYRDKIAKAPAGDKQRLVDEANTAMKKAVTDQGLSVEEYTTIVDVAQKDPAVRDKLLRRLQ